MNELKFPLSNVQMELLKIYSTGLTESEIEELKTVLSGFYASKAIKQANEIWDKKGLTDADMEEWLNQNS